MLARLRDTEPGLQVLDVREDWELALCRLNGSIHIPMAEVPDRLGELDPSRPLAVMCHHGGRSLRVTAWLRGHGFPLASNVAGGIHRWAEEVDPSLAVY